MLAGRPVAAQGAAITVQQAIERIQKNIGAPWERETLDGVKFFLENATCAGKKNAAETWLLLRASGTEPLLRVYCESCSQASVQQVLKAAHTFNLLDARGAISVTERAGYIGRIRGLAKSVAQSYYESRERLGFPMLPKAVA